MNLKITSRVLTSLFLFVTVSIGGYSYAKNKVVVVPLGSDAGVSGYEIVRNTVSATLSSSGTQNVVVYCPEGKVAMGGGGVAEKLAIIASATLPRNDFVGSGWLVRFRNTASTSLSGSLTAYVTCSKAI